MSARVDAVAAWLYEIHDSIRTRDAALAEAEELLARADQAEAGAGSRLRWWRLWGTYSAALVAAETEERAIAMAGDADPGRAPFINPDDDGEAYDRCPGPPTAEGVYVVFAE